MYTREQLIKYLENILNRYGEITTSIIDLDKFVINILLYLKNLLSL